MIQGYLLSLPILLLFFVVTSGQNKILCQKFQNATTLSGRYTFLTDQWGLDGSGYQCMNVSLGESNTITASNTTSFSATWSWAGVSANATTVHAYPNVNLNSHLLPLRLANLSALPISATWSLSPGGYMDAASTSADELAAIDTRADVALDMFLDMDPLNATSADRATTEIMVWQAAYGGVRPIGWSNTTSSSPRMTLSQTQYTLSHGHNGNNQSVYSWYPDTNSTDFTDVDISPLIHYLWRHHCISEQIHLGLVQWGSEAIHSAKDRDVTFNAMSVSIDVVKGTPKAARADALAIAYWHIPFALLLATLPNIILNLF